MLQLFRSVSTHSVRAVRRLSTLDATKVAFDEMVSRSQNDLKTIVQKVESNGLRAKLEDLEKEMSKADFWEVNDSRKCARINQKAAKYRQTLESLDTMRRDLEDFKELFADADTDVEFAEDCVEGVRKVQKEARKISTELLFSREGDEMDCMVEISSGSGGTEACDWAHMLMVAYTKLAGNLGFKTSHAQFTPAEVGIRSCILKVEGPNAFGWLKTESGVHRLVRISPYDSQARRHTSFAQLTVLPVSDTSEEEVDKKDLKIDTFRSGGPGGQHANVTDSAVRVTHLPSGIVVSCQSQRSQHMNRETALQVLAGKLLKAKLEREQKQMLELRGEVAEGTFGNQIRSYVLHPYKLVKDHRTGMQAGGVEKALNGSLEVFVPMIEASLMKLP